MKHTGGKWQDGSLHITVTLEPIETRANASDELPTEPATVELRIDVAQLRSYMAKALRSKAGRCQLAFGAVKMVRRGKLVMP